MAALRYPEHLRSLSLLDGIVPLPGWEKSFYASIEHYAGMIERARARGQELDEMITWLRENVGASRRHATIVARRICRLFEQTTLRADIRDEVALAEEEIGRIRCPTLAVYGERSDLHHLIDELPRLLPDVRTRTLPGADHQDVYWRIGEVRPLVRGFLGLPSPG